MLKQARCQTCRDGLRIQEAGTSGRTLREIASRLAPCEANPKPRKHFQSVNRLARGRRRIQPCHVSGQAMSSNWLCGKNVRQLTMRSRPLASGRGSSRGFGLVSFLSDVVLKRQQVFVGQVWIGGHAAIDLGATAHHLLEYRRGERNSGRAQIRRHAAGNHSPAVTGSTEAPDGTTLLGQRRVNLVAWNHNRLGEIRSGLLGEFCLSFQREAHQTAPMHAIGPALKALSQSRRRTAPAYEQRQVLTAIQAIGDRRRRNSQAQIDRPNGLSRGGTIGDQLSIGASLKDQVPRRAEGSRIPVVILRNGPCRLLLDRIPRLQGPRIVVRRLGRPKNYAKSAVKFMERQVLVNPEIRLLTSSATASWSPCRQNENCRDAAIRFRPGNHVAARPRTRPARRSWKDSNSGPWG